MLYAYDTNAAAQTATELVAAPGAGKQIVVVGVTVSSIVDDTWTFHDEDDTGLLGPLQLLAKTTVPVAHGDADVFVVAANKALEYTTTGAGVNAVAISYQIRDA